MFKKFGFFISFMLALSAFMLSSYAFAQISFDAEYGDERFAPADMYHAECLSTMQLGFDMKHPDKVKNVHLILDYDEETLQIIQLKGEYKGTYTVGYDKLVLDFDIDQDTNANEMSDKFAQLQFKSKAGVASGKFIVNDGSYYINSKGDKISLEGESVVNFVEVPECEPDIISPSINMLYPKDGSTGQALDTYFVFDVRDGEKGINKKSFSLELNDILYEIDNTSSGYSNDGMFKRSGSYLFFFPDTWLAVDEDIDLKVRVADKQEYGGPNWVEEEFSIHTATGVLLNSEINPNMMRLFKQKSQQLTASSSECAVLNQTYGESDIYNKYKLKSVMDKLACDVNPDAFAISDDEDMTTVSGIVLDDDAMGSEDKLGLFRSKGFSVFAVLGWLLFIVTLLLKFHYIHASHKYKKKYKKSSKSGRTNVATVKKKVNKPNIDRTGLGF